MDPVYLWSSKGIFYGMDSFYIHCRWSLAYFQFLFGRHLNLKIFPHLPVSRWILSVSLMNNWLIFSLDSAHHLAKILMLLSSSTLLLNRVKLIGVLRSKRAIFLVGGFFDNLSEIVLLKSWRLPSWYPCLCSWRSMFIVYCHRFQPWKSNDLIISDSTLIFIKYCGGGLSLKFICIIEIAQSLF